MKRIGMLCAVSLFCAGFLFAESDEAVYKPITIDIVPGTGAAGEKVSTNIALGTIGSIVYRVNGLQAAGIMSLAGEDVHGLQGSGVSTSRTGPFTASRVRASSISAEGGSTAFKRQASLTWLERDSPDSRCPEYST